MASKLTVCISCGPARRELATIIREIVDSNTDEQFNFVVIFDGWEPGREVLQGLQGVGDITFQVNESAQGQIICRNTQASIAKTELIAFLDDDLSDVSLPVAKISTFMDLNPHISAIRGKLAGAGIACPTPPHWDRGDEISTSSIDLEGLSVFRRQVFLDHGGFHNPSGETIAHEGIDLTWQIALESGPRSTAYHPSLNAKHPVRSKVLSKRSETKPRLDAAVKVTPQEVNSLYHKMRGEEFGLSDHSKLTYAVLTTSANTNKWGEEYLKHLRRQTALPDEIVFVSDEHALPEGFERKLADLGVSKTKVLSTDERGRSSSLNIGIQNVESDVILVWDVDDHYFPYRIGWTKFQFEKDADNQLDFLGGSMIKEGSQSTRWPQLPVAGREAFLARLLEAEIPVPFPAVAFRKSSNPEPFREDAKAAVDVHWYVDNLKNWRISLVIPEPLLLYRKSRTQISANRSATQVQEKQRAVDRLRAQFISTISSEYFFHHRQVEDSSAYPTFAKLFSSSQGGSDVDLVLSSMSWRVTAPLRKMAAMLRLLPMLKKILDSLPRKRTKKDK